MSKYSKYVEERWGKRGVEECKNHITNELERFFPMFARIWLPKERKGAEKS